MILKNRLKICGIINYIIASIGILYLCFASFDINLFISMTVLIIVGSLLYKFSCEEEMELKNRKLMLTILGIIMLFLNPIIGIILLVSLDELAKIKIDINAPPVNKESVDPETKKLDIVLKIGVGMVLLSGIIIATSNWAGIPDLVKSLMIFVLGLLFLLLAFLSNRYIKVESSEIMYFSLGMIFIWLSYFSLGWYSLFKDAFELNSSLNLLFNASCCILAAILCYVSYAKFNEKYLKVVAYFALGISAILLLFYFKIGIEFLFLIISLIIFGFSILFRNNKIGRLLCNILMYINVLFVMVLCFNNNIVMSFILTLVICGYMFYTSNTKYSVCNALSMGLITVVLIGGLEFKTYIDGVAFYIALGLLLVYSLITLIPGLFKNKMFNVSVDLVGSVFTLLYFVFYFFDSVDYYDNFAFDYSYVYIAIYSAILLVGYFVILFFKYKDNEEIREFSYSLLFPIVNCLLYYLINIDVVTTICIIYLGYTLFSSFVNNKCVKYYNMGFLVASFISLQVYPAVVPSILFPITTCIYFAFFKDNKVFKNILFVITLFIIYCSYTICLPSAISNDIGIWVFALITIVLYLVIIGIFRNDKFKVISTLILLLLPIISLVGELNINGTIIFIIYSLYIVIITFIINLFIIKKKSTRLVIYLAFLIPILTANVYYGEIGTGIFVLVLSLILIIIGLIDDYYNSLFVVGGVYLIFDILYQLRNYLEDIPFWLYLLVAGLSLIGIVTFKQIKRK